jgi:hypothetical protein
MAIQIFSDDVDALRIESVVLQLVRHALLYDEHARADRRQRTLGITPENFAHSIWHRRWSHREGLQEGAGISHDGRSIWE